MRNRLPWLRAAGVGAGVHLTCWLALLAANGGFRVMAQEDERLTRLVLDEYLWTLVAALAASLLLALLVGALSGVFVAFTLRGLLALCGRLRRAAPAPPPGVPLSHTAASHPPRPAWIAAGVALAHLGAWTWHIRHYPQIHAETFFNRGGVWAAMQRGITHGLPAWVFPAMVALGAALPALAVLERFVSQPSTRRPLLGIAGALAVAWATLGRTTCDEPSRPSGPPNILLLANDSMRPDHLGVEGYPGDGAPSISPNLDRFADSAIVFEDAYVPVARTFPSWASILTGRMPHEHGIRHMFPRAGARLHDQLTLPRYLAAHGYRTEVVADYAGDVFRRMGAGFERVRAPDFDLPALIRQRILQVEPAWLPYIDSRIGRWLFPDQVGLVNYPHTGATVDEILRALHDDDDRPFFIVGFLSSSHFPYAAADPWYRRYVNPAYGGTHLYQRFRGLSETEAQLARDAPHLTALYDGTIAYFDAEIGRLLDHIDATPHREDTIVIVTADHGEILYDFGTTGHGDHLRGRAAHRVPLMIRDPGLAPRRVPGLVRSTDLARTLAIRATGRAPPELGGVDLAPLLRGDTHDLGLLGRGETGLWFSRDGEAFYQRQRLHYPSLPAVVEIDPDAPGEISLNPAYEDRIRVAKHRAVWDRTHKVIVAPTPDGPVLEGWRLEGASEVPAEPRADLVEALEDLLTEGGRARLVQGYSIPVAPVEAP